MPVFHPPLPIVTYPIYKLLVIGELYGQTTINTFAYADLAPGAPMPSSGLLEQSAVDIWNILKVGWLPAVTNNWSAVRLVCSNPNVPATRPGIADFTPGTVVGTHAGSADSSWVAMKVNRITAINGLAGQGCVRISGLATTEILGNQMSAAQKTLMNTFATKMELPVGSTVNPGLTMTPVLLKAGIGSSPIQRAAVIVETNVSSYLSSQKTRRTRVVV